MVVDRIENAKLYHGLGARIATALEFIAGVSAEGFEEKTVEIDARNVYAMLQAYETEGEAGRAYEAHRKYIDVQYVVDGRETFRVTDVGSLTPQIDYDPERDFTLYELAPGSDLRLGPGDFAVFFPHDAHVPKLMTDAPSAVKKVVVKVAV
jgi:YhcH/YjgK/YiaL family protein